MTIVSGARIKHLRKTTNTFISAPMRGRKPCFFIRGLRENVTSAINKIADISNEYTEALQKLNRHSGVRIYVPVETRFIGLVIGVRGKIIKSIQDKTDTSIITPLRSKQTDDVVAFDVRGETSNVFRARDLMYRYIFDRTEINLEKVNSQIYGIEAALNGLEMYKKVEHPETTHLPVLDVRAHHSTWPFTHEDTPDSISTNNSTSSSTNSSVESSPTMALDVVAWVRRSMCSTCGRRECINFPSKCGHATFCRQCFKKYLCVDPNCPGYYGRIPM